MVGMATKLQMSHAEQCGALVQGFSIIQGFRQRELAELLGLAQSSISARLAGRTPFTVEEIATLAAAFDVEPGDLIPAVVTP